MHTVFYWVMKDHLQDKSLLNEDVSSQTSLFRTDPLDVYILDVEDFVKKNNVQPITNHITFVRDGIPTSDGLLSNEIFGITKEERSGIYGYIDLNDWFMNPLCYKVWGSMDRRIKNIAHSIEKYSIGPDGDFVEDPKGGTGMAWLRKNIDKVKIKSTESRKRDNKIAFLEKNKDKMFIRKFIVIPPFYRDVSNTKGRVEIGAINNYYQSIILTSNSIKDRQEMFGVEAGEADKGRMQEMLVAVYKALSGTSTNPDDGLGLGKKQGIIEQAGKSKTTDAGSRLVLSAPNLNVESIDDLMVDMQHCALPLASAVTNFKPFVIFNVKRFFDNELGGTNTVPICKANGTIDYVEIRDVRSQFSDAVIEEHVEQFIHGFSNRLDPVMVELETEGKQKKYAQMVFKGKTVSSEEYASGKISGESPLINRPLTWCDVLYIATMEATRDKHVLITRYPIDKVWNQFPSKINISTTKEMEPVYVNGKLYKFYPKIRKEDVGSNTSNKFVDTMNICNLLLDGIGGDYRPTKISLL